MRPKRIFLWSIALLLAPVVLLAFWTIGFALWHGRDLQHGISAALADKPDFTTDHESLVRADYEDPVFVGNLGSGEVREASGLAPSLRRDDVLWVINDNGAEPRLYPLRLDGHDLGSFKLPEGTDWNEDWEDLDSFEHEGKPYLVIGDIGDNLSWIETRRVLFVPEPEIAGASKDWKGQAEVAWSYRFRYPDGPRDSESLAVDATGGRILVLSKRAFPATLYSLPLRPEDLDEVQVAQKIADLATLPRPTKYERDIHGLLGLALGQPTAMDISADGLEAVILTYNRIYVFRRGPGESWASAFARPPKSFEVPLMSQAEALSFNGDETALYFTTEGRPASLFRADRRPN